MGAGISADSEGNVYAATGNARIKDPSQDDGQSYVKVAGLPWTGTLQAKFQHQDPDNFLVTNELEGSSGPIVLPGIGGVERILGASKMGFSLSWTLLRCFRCKVLFEARGIATNLSWVTQISQ
jgi:hypothetical protein